MHQTNRINKLIRVGISSSMVWAFSPFAVLAQSIPFPFSESLTPTRSPAISLNDESNPDELNDAFCVSQNSLQQDEQIIVGDIPDFPYVVVVPGQGSDLLTEVRQCVPDAFQTDLRLGPYIRAGAFPDRRSAEQLSRYLRRSLKLNARVMYLP